MTEESRKSLIEVLAKEIELNIIARYSFRHRVNFTLFVSPFVLLSGYLYANKGKIPIPSISDNLFLIVLVGVVYLLIGVACSRVEQALIRRNDTLRNKISMLSYRKLKDLKLIDFTRDVGFTLIRSYVIVYLLLIVEFIMICKLLV